ncbi:MAG: amino acid adenylation domain-containing protein [Candidatus Aminicenantes bacterium]|nr:amino acid adenylation domain-containing protein [Candidatus Aminicenantes bacterium]
MHHSNQLSYLIYTSGTTGKPKGVMVEHRNVVAYVYAFLRQFHIDSTDTVIQLASYCFDAFVEEVFPVLSKGGRLVIPGRAEIVEINRLLRLMAKYRVTMIDCTPLLLNEFDKLHTDTGSAALESVRTFISGGDVLKPGYVEHLLKIGRVYNTYGPTESTVCAAYFHYSGAAGDLTSIPIGKSISNYKIYILDEHRKPVPIGVAGELCVSGPGITRGYLNRPELTSEKFIDLHHSSFDLPRIHHLKLYCTGDLARWLPDGNIEYLGRVDSQVKIRGYRIELGEIEVQLLRHDSVKEAVVLDREGETGGKYLCAYIVSKEALDLTGLREYLLHRLPDYMIPAYFIPVDRIPFTVGGKVDRKALQSYKTTLGAAVEYVAPGSDLEQRIADSWKEVLKLEKVSIHDNFFERGGNSLSIIQLTNSVNNVLGKDLPVVTFFQYPTISALARHLEGNQPKTSLSPAGKAAKVATDFPFTLKESMDIAVVGMAARFPGAVNIDEFWDNLKEGVESISFFTDEELAAAGVAQELLHDPNYVKASGIIEGKEKFDAAFFDYIPAEARLMDPQMRLFHECAWEAFENAGYIPDIYDGSIGVYAGASNSIEWGLKVLFSEEGRATGGFEVGQLIDKDFLATRISYKLNLRGPAISIKTACSTSLVAVHMACRALLTRECDMAVAGGVTLGGADKEGYLFQEGMILSRDGHCRPFDAHAEGTVSGEGIGIVILKRVKDAETDGDNIYAVVKGSAVNNDGFNKVGYTAPSVEGQREVIAKALFQAGVEPDTISYVETHGTGTILGDPIEIKALTLAFATDKRNYCAIGSVKSNVGHLDAAAGIAGFIKTVMALYHRQIPPTLHFKNPNPAIDFENSPFYVNTQLRPWKSHGHPLRAGVSSFGIGGTNAHVVLEEWPGIERSHEESEGREERDYQLILLSAKTSPALAEMRERLADYLKENPVLKLADAAYTLQVGRKSFKRRAILTASSGEEASDILKSADKMQSHLLTEEKQNIVFMFPGQGSQYVDMTRGLYENEPVFRREMDHCFEILQPITGHDFKKILYPSLEDSRSNRSNRTNIIDQTEMTQPVIFMIEYALAQLLMAWGIKPRSMIGHSIGEYTAACLSGVFSLADALEIVCMRGKLMQQLPGGTMLSVPLAEKELMPLLGGMDNISLAAVNSSLHCVVSGTHEAVEAFEKQLGKKGYQSRRLHTSHAFHSAMMNPIVEEFAREVEGVILNKPSIPFLSNVTGTWVTMEDAVDPGYWARHLRQTVRFLDGITELLNDPLWPSVFIEVGPGKVLSTFVRQHAGRKNRPYKVVDLVRRPQEDTADDKYLLEKVGQLWLYGVTPDWHTFHFVRNRKRIPLPTYPFERREFRLQGNLMDIVNSFSGFQMAPKHKRTVEKEQGEDIAAFSKPDWGQRPDLCTVYTSPCNETEQTLTQIWERFFGIEMLGCNDDFSELGGDSLKAVTLIARIQKAMNVRVPLADFFKNATISGLAAYIGKSSYQQFHAIETVETMEYYELSSAQKRLYILQQMDPLSTSYNLPQVAMLEGKLDREHLEMAFRKLIRRHESLRTSFEMINEEPVQRVHDEVEFNIEYYDLATDERGQTRIIHSFIHPFDLSCAPLMRVGLIKETEIKHILIVDIHHIVTDGTSMELLIKEFKLFYMDKELAPLQVQYKDYAWWQSCGEQKEAIRHQEAYWLEQYSGEIPVLELFMDFARPAMQSFEGHSLGFELSAQEIKGLKKIAAQEGVTLYMVLQSVITIFLAKLSNQEDIIVGTPTAGRRHADLERIIGMFVNTLAIRNFPVGEKRFTDFLGEVKASTLAAFENQDYQFEDLVGQVLVNRDMGRNSLFDVVFVLQNLDVQSWSVPGINIPGLVVKPYESELLTAKFDITLSCFEDHDGLLFSLEYCTKLFKKETIERFIDYYKNVISAVIERPDRKIADIEIMNDAEKLQILDEFNETESFYPGEKTIHELFENEVEKTPDRIALVGAALSVRPVGVVSLSYSQLNEQSGRLAQALIEKGVLVDSIVGIMLERSNDMIIGILGILKSGGAYLPIDPEYPQERIDYMLKDSGAKMMIGRAEEQKSGRAEFVFSSFFLASSLPRFFASDSSNLAYIIYTSGSTGRPRGVMVEHRNVVRLVKNTNYVEFRENDRLLQTGALEFDASTFEIWGSLLNGMTFCVAAKDEILNPAKLKENIRKYDICTMWLTSPLFNQLVTVDIEIFDGLWNLLVGGDVLSPLHINRIRERFPRLNIINGYGPTENTTFSTTYRIDKPYTSRVPIGRPIANSTAYVVDRAGHLSPLGVAGELLVGGEGVSRGYLNNPELTAEKFINFHHSSFDLPRIHHSKLYCTGDLARWLADGPPAGGATKVIIEFLGRIDQQVKIRGFRIELGEIEAELSKHDLVKEAVVIDRQSETGEKYLCGYIAAGEGFDLSSLREYLSRSLPDYMIPSHFMSIERIPLTVNGKLDRRALPEPGVTVGEDYATPQNEIEAQIAAIWSEVLGIEKSKISIDADFFDLGGHSLKAMVMIAKIHKVLNRKLELMQIFKIPTIRGIASLIEAVDWVNTGNTADKSIDSDVEQESEEVIL